MLLTVPCAQILLITCRVCPPTLLRSLRSLRAPASGLRCHSARYARSVSAACRLAATGFAMAIVRAHRCAPARCRETPLAALNCDNRCILSLAIRMIIECSEGQSGRTFFVGWRIETRGAPARAPRYLALFPFPLPSCSPLPQGKIGRTFFVGWRVVRGGPTLALPPPRPPLPELLLLFLF